jgi:hypothetical protein
MLAGAMVSVTWAEKEERSGGLVGSVAIVVRCGMRTGEITRN